MPKLFTAEEKKVLAELFKGMNFHDPVERNAVATELIRFVVNDVYSQDLVNIIADTERFGPGETLEFHILDEVLAYIIEPGSFLPRSRMTKKVVELPKHRVGVSVSLDIKQLRSGRYGTINDIRRKVAEALLGQRNKLVWDTAFAAIASGDSNYTTFNSSASADTKKTALDTAISYVLDNTNGGRMWIVGRHSALDWIEQIDGSKWFSDNARDTILTQTGLLGNYKGVPVIRLRGYKDRNATQAINANHILILNEGMVKFGEVEPGLEVFDELDGTRTLEWVIAFWEENGVAVVEPERGYHLEIV